MRAELNKRWSFFAEGQLRSLRFYDHFHYYEYKGGPVFKLDNNFSFTTGFGRYNTYGSGGNFKRPTQQREYRSWLQVNMKNRIKRVEIEHRYRAEQRFTSRGYRNRFRYRLSANVPLNGKDAARPLYLQPSNEIFLTNRAPFFERNRSAVNLGYVLSKKFTMQTGILHQYDYRLTDETGSTFFQIAGLFTLDLKKNKAGVRGDVED